jgi:2-dehydropantoate 2-reductase
MDETEPIAIVGAGAVGLALGARLARAGRAVRFHVRAEAAARALRGEGVRVEDPATGASWQAAVEARVGPPAGAAGPVFLCVRRPDTEALAGALAAASPAAVPVNVQNGVDGDAVLAARFPLVVGAVWRLPCTRIAANRVRTIGAGRIVVGAHPEGAGPEAEAVAALLREAGFDVGVAARLAEDRWLKLCVNLMSTPNALVRPAEHATRAFVEGKARLLEEARSVLRAAGVAARSCDGRDRSLDEEIAWVRGGLARGDAARPLPLYNSVWQALRDGLPLETDDYHRRIAALGAAHGIATPGNERVLAGLLRARAERLGPECFGAAELLGPAES